MGSILLTQEALTSEAAAASCASCWRRSQPGRTCRSCCWLAGGEAAPASRHFEALLGRTANVTLVERPVRAATLVSTLQAALRARRRQYEARDHLLALMRSEAALRESEERYRQLVEPNIVGIISADVDRVLDANDAFLRMVGYTREELEAGDLRWREMTPPEYTPLDDRALEELLATGRATPFEKEFFRKDGTRVPILLGASLLEREPLKWVCFIQDITDRKLAEQAREDFLRAISHDLGQPVTVISGQAQLLQRLHARDSADARIPQGLGVIRASAERLAGMLRDLADCSGWSRASCRCAARRPISTRCSPTSWIAHPCRRQGARGPGGARHHAAGDGRSRAAPTSGSQPPHQRPEILGAWHARGPQAGDRRR